MVALGSAVASKLCTLPLGLGGVGVGTLSASLATFTGLQPSASPALPAAFRLGLSHMLVPLVEMLFPAFLGKATANPAHPSDLTGKTTSSGRRLESD